MSQHSPNYKHSNHLYSSPIYQDSSSQYIYQPNIDAQQYFPSQNVDYGYTYIGQSVPTQIIKLESEYRQPIKKVVYGETIRSGAEYKYTSEACCDECAHGQPCASTKPQPQQMNTQSCCMPMVNQTRTVKYMTRKESNKQASDDMVKKLNDLERLHLQEIQDLTFKMEQQFVQYQKQQKAEEYSKEINELRSTISELRSKLCNPQPCPPPPPPMMPPQCMMMPPPQQQPLQNDRNEIDRLERKLEENKRKNKSLKNENNTLKSENNILKSENNTLKSENNTLHLENNTLKSENNEQRKKLEIPPSPQLPQVRIPTPPQIVVQEDMNRIMGLEREREELLRELDYLRANFQELGHLRGILFEKDLNQRDYDLRIRDLVRNVQIMDEEIHKMYSAIQAKDKIIQTQEREIQLLRKEFNKQPAPTFIETSVRPIPTQQDYIFNNQNSQTGYQTLTQYRGYQSSSPPALAQAVQIEQLPASQVYAQQLPIPILQQQERRNG